MPALSEDDEDDEEDKKLLVKTVEPHQDMVNKSTNQSNGSNLFAIGAFLFKI